MAGANSTRNNKVKNTQNVYLKKDEKAYFAVLPIYLEVPDKEYGSRNIFDGFLYTCHIKYIKKLTKLYENS